MTTAKRLISFFQGRDRLLGWLLLAGMIGGAFFEAIGVAAILPLLALISAPDALTHPGWLRSLYDASGVTSPRGFVIVCTAALMIVYCCKAAYLTGLNFLQYRFTVNAQVALSRRLLATYLAAPYPFHLQHNSAELQRRLNSDILLVFNNVVVPVFRMLIETFVVIAVTLLLLVVVPLPTLAAITVLGGAGGLFFLLMRSRTSAYGRAQTERFGEMMQDVNQALGSAKEAKVLGREAYFVDAYARCGVAYARAARFYGVSSELPRIAIESLAVVGMLAVVIVMALREDNLPNLVPALGLFAMAAMRLMPSVNRIVQGVTAMRFFSASIDAVYDDLQLLEAETTLSPAGDSDAGRVERSSAPTPDWHLREALELRDVHYRYEGANRWALDGLTMRVAAGQTVALVGPSGAGKTTLVDLILGLLPPESGVVLADGRDIYADLAGWRRQIGYVPQSVYLIDDTVRRNVAFGLADAAIDDARVWRALEVARMAGVVRELPRQLDGMVGEHGARISGGQRQRLGIARALYHDPTVLVLDEATSAVDNEMESQILQAIAALRPRMTVLMIAHRLTTVRHCDQLFFLREGRVQATGTYEQLLERNSAFRAMALVGDAAALVGEH